ncbi:MAG: CHASE3 domain-containing protein, partial [Bradyrhizobium sp.]
MPSQRIILGIGLAILLVIGAASIRLDIQSRSGTASVDRALGTLRNISDVRPLLRRAESAARAFALSGDQHFVGEFREASAAIAPALAALAEAVKDSPFERQLIDEARALMERQLALNDEMIRLRTAGDGAAATAVLAREDRTASATIARNLAQAVAENRRLIEARRAEYESNGRLLLAIDLVGVTLILLLATILTVSTRRSRRELQETLLATRATNEALEAAVAERTEHLTAAHDELRLSAAVLRSTFHSMAEAVIVIDSKGEVLLSNPAAEKMLLFRPGMTLELMRSLGNIFHADGVTPLPAHDMPASRALRGETFD